MIQSPTISLDVISVQGPRATQEDRWITARINSGEFLAVFDGHGGSSVAEYASQRVGALFAKCLQASAPADALRDAIRILQQETRNESAGSTATLAYLKNREAFIAVLGDSPVALMDDTGTVIVCPTHNVNMNPTERAAAESRGALFQNGYLHDPKNLTFGLQMGRALGDVALGAILDRQPDIYRFGINEDFLLLLGSDGLIDSGEISVEGTIQSLLGKALAGSTASELAKDALHRRTGDNVTAIVARGPGRLLF